MEHLVQVLALGETPTYQMKEKFVWTLKCELWTDQDKKEGRQKVYFWGVYCLDHSKLEVVLQSCWISLMTDDHGNLWKSE